MPEHPINEALRSAFRHRGIGSRYVEVSGQTAGLVLTGPPVRAALAGLDHATALLTFDTEWTVSVVDAEHGDAELSTITPLRDPTAVALWASAVVDAIAHDTREGA